MSEERSFWLRWLGRILLFLTAVSVGGAAYFYASQEGKREIERSLPLVADATSFHITEGTGDNIVERDTICPTTFDERRIKAGVVVGRTVQVNMQKFTMNSSGRWILWPGLDLQPCRSGPPMGGSALSSTLRQIHDMSGVEKGPEKMVNGANCRVYHVTPPFWALGSPALTFYKGDLCIDETTHYPVEVRVNGYSIVYSRWNEPLTVEFPEVDRAEIYTPDGRHAFPDAVPPPPQPTIYSNPNDSYPDPQ